MLDSQHHRPPDQPPEPSTDKKPVLVVEDDRGIALLIAAILEDAGYLPHVVQDGRRAIQLAQELHPCVVTLDLELPGIDGRTILRRLATDHQSEHPPVVIVSARTELLSREERRLAARALRKPFDLYELVEAVDEVAAQEAS